MIERIDTRSLSDQQRFVITATRGLVQYRAGDRLAGRRLYELAIADANKLKDEKEHVARLYFAIEEVRAQTPYAEELRKEALERAAVLTDSHYLAMIDRLKKFKP